MKTLKFILVFLLFATAACSGTDTPAKQEISDEEIAQTVEATNVAEIEVEGMTCEMGCGGDIRKALRHTGGVAEVDFDFVSDRKVNIAKVKYDQKSIQPEELKKVIAGLNNGQFTVGQISTNTLDVEQDAPKSSSDEKEESTVQMKDSFLSLSDLAAIAASWFL
jgi:Cu+-exporting ATPase